MESDVIIRVGTNGSATDMDEAALMADVKTLAERGESALASQKLKAALRQNPDLAGAHVMQAQFMLAHEEYDGAAGHAAAAIALGAGTAEAFDLLIEAEVGREQPDSAVKAIMERARVLGPDHAALRHSAHLLMQRQNFPQTISVLEKVRQDFPDDIDAVYYLAYASEHAGLPEQALAHAQFCYEQQPMVGSHGDFLVHLLHLQKRNSEAIAILQDMNSRQTGSAARYRVLSGILLISGRPRDALNEVVNAIKVDPEQAEYWSLAGNTAVQLGFGAQALQFLRKAAELAPSDAPIHFNLGHQLFLQNHIEEALAEVTIAIQLAPKQAHYRDFRISILEQRRQASLVPAGDAPEQLIKPLPRSIDGPAGMAARRGGTGILPAMRVQWRVIWHLTQREIRLRDAKSRLGILTVVIEPVAHVVALWAVMSVMQHGRPPLGEHWFFFYSTGIIPFLMISHMAAHGLIGREMHRHILDVPIIKEFDLFIASALGELIIGGTVAVLIFSVLWMVGAYHSINNPGTLIAAYLAIWMFGIGLMVMNHSLSAVLPVWPRAWYTIQRLAYFTSGIFYMAQHMPGFVRDILVWNPLLIGIEWFRSGFFEQYQPPWLAPGYMLAVSFGTIVTGFMLEHAFRRHAH